jgi:hypothetical protein
VKERDDEDEGGENVEGSGFGSAPPRTLEVGQRDIDSIDVIYSVMTGALCTIVKSPCS